MNALGLTIGAVVMLIAGYALGRRDERDFVRGRPHRWFL